MAQRSQTLQQGWGTPQNKVKLKGLRAPERPSDEAPDLPAGLSDLPDTDLMELYTEFINWTGYAGYLAAEADIAERKTQRVLQRVSDRYTIVHKSQKTVAAIKALVQQEEEYQEAEDLVDEAYAYGKLIGSLYIHYEKCGNTVSRELSRRLSRNDSERRNSKYTT
jgi:hypothetical protein